MKRQMKNNSLALNFQQGFEAFSRIEQRGNPTFGKRYHQVANPLKPDTTPHREWQRGWNAAYFEQLERANELRTRS